MESTLEAPAARFTPRQVRVLGSLLLAIGSALAIGVAVLLVNIAPTLLHPGQTIGGTRFTGSADLGHMVMGLLGWIVLDGLAFAGVGIHQISTGRRNKWLLYLAGAMIAITVVAAWQVNAAIT
jgi:hypothetical protein